jgi:hypothetical protein
MSRKISYRAHCGGGDDWFVSAGASARGGVDGSGFHGALAEAGTAAGGEVAGGRRERPFEALVWASGWNSPELMQVGVRAGVGVIRVRAAVLRVRADGKPEPVGVGARCGERFLVRHPKVEIGRRRVAVSNGFRPGRSNERG